MKYIKFTCFNWDIRISLAARQPWTHFKVHHTEYSMHIVWGKLSIMIENWKLEVHQVCAECGSSDISEQDCGDEYLTICSSCRSVEQGYKYVNLREFEESV